MLVNGVANGGGVLVVFVLCCRCDLSRPVKTSMAKPVDSYTKYWCFTENNPERVKLEMPKDGTYLVWQLEKGANGTPHLQGYVEFASKKRSSWVHKHFLPRGAFFVRKKQLAAEARAYCMKEQTRVEGPWELGEISNPEPGKAKGKRTDLEAFKEDAKRLSQSQMIDKYPMEMSRYWRLYNLVVQSHEPAWSGARNVILLYGPPGTGKTMWARTLYPKDETRTLMVSKQLWFDGVTRDTKCVILDEFVGNYKLRHMMQIMHEWPETMPIKGGSTWFVPETLILITNVHPEKWWVKQYKEGTKVRGIDVGGEDMPDRPVVESMREAVGRRFTQLLYFPKGERNDADLWTIGRPVGCEVDWEFGPTLDECKQRLAVFKAKYETCVAVAVAGPVAGEKRKRSEMEGESSDNEDGGVVVVNSDEE